ncbi:MAG TPA: DHH family phosphoesterase [Cytophagales bacterium]|nr:DHH family phosphoesterase [Cytophagales bacterium]HAP64247.1 DHH family phosphoesterase [Cytophagales bacterium]
MQNLEQFQALLSTPKRVVITTHHKPDADALGSSLGLAGYLKQYNHQVTVITPTDYPTFLNWMEGNNEVVVFTNTGMETKAAELVADADIIFCLDFSSLDRINQLGELVRASSAKKVLIDHHRNPEDFAQFVEWDVEAAATAQLIYRLLCAMGDREKITPAIADCLYAGIMTDTGSFRHSNTSKEVHLVVAELIDLGANVNRVSQLIYDNGSLDRLRFMGYALSERLEVLPQYSTAYIAISAEDLMRFQIKTGDTEGLVNYALSIEGVCFAALITEREDGVKLSLRSVGDFSVSDLASKHFNGGGHKNAAGGRSDKSFTETLAYFESLLPQYQSLLDTTNQLQNAHV